MASSKITIGAFYRWMINHDDDLFSLLSLPEGVDKDVLVNNIMMQSAPFEVVYSDPYVMQGLIGAWSDAHEVMWQRWYDTWLASDDFNPLENFDRKENESITNSGTDQSGNTQTRNLAGTDNRTVNLADNQTKNLVDEHQVSAYDSSSYSPKDKDTHTGTDNMAHTGTDNRAMSDTGTVTDAGSFTHGHKIDRESRYHGNIGVTSMSQLLNAWMDSVDKWDIYALITNQFLNEFCILVY